MGGMTPPFANNALINGSGVDTPSGLAFYRNDTD